MSLECCKDNFYVIFLMLQYLQNLDILLSQVVEPYPSNRLRKEPENPVPNRLVRPQPARRLVFLWCIMVSETKAMADCSHSLPPNIIYSLY